MGNEQQILSILRQYRLRSTKTRRAVLGLFLQTHTPLSAQKILWALGKISLTVDKTTVYRELEKLATMGLLERMRLQDRQQYYELAARDHHHHFICTLCDQVTDVEINESKILATAEQMGQKTGFHITSHVVEFYGQCATCLKAFLFRQSV